MTERNKRLLINTALMSHRDKLIKKLEKEKEKLDKLCSITMPPRTGIRGGANTKLASRIEVCVETKKTLEEQIQVLNEEINKKY